jgi:hypothetical protein
MINGKLNEFVVLWCVSGNGEIKTDVDSWILRLFVDTLWAFQIIILEHIF